MHCTNSMATFSQCARTRTHHQPFEIYIIGSHSSLSTTFMFMRVYIYGHDRCRVSLRIPHFRCKLCALHYILMPEICQCPSPPPPPPPLKCAPNTLSLFKSCGTCLYAANIFKFIRFCCVAVLFQFWVCDTMVGGRAVGGWLVGVTLNLHVFVRVVEYKIQNTMFSLINSSYIRNEFCVASQTSTSIPAI